MEISLLSENALKIKGKKSLLLVDVLDVQKTPARIATQSVAGGEANAYLYLNADVLQVKKDKNALLISGPGEYEVSGTKIAAFRSNNDLLYQLTIDGIKMVLASSSAFVRMKDKIDEQNIVMLFTNELIDQSALTNAQPTVVICYGDKASEVSANLGNKREPARLASESVAGGAESNPDATIKPTDKFVISVEKLPTELQVVLLG